MLVHCSITDAIPASIYGFDIRVSVGPYPPDSLRSKRRAVYATLTPADPAVQRRMHAAGKSKIVSSVPITAAAAARIGAGDDDLAEAVALRAIQAASKAARIVWESAQ